MKKLISLFLCIILLFSIIPAELVGYSEDSPITVTVNGQPIPFDQPPVLMEGRTLVPIRGVIEAMNGTVDWNEEAKTTTLTLGYDVIQLTIGSDTATVNGVAYELDVPPQIINDRTLLPIRFIAENFHFRVDWNEETKTVIISTLSSEEVLVSHLMSQMTLSEMIYQMLFVTPEALTNVGQVVSAGETTKQALQRHPVGGIVYFAANLENRQQTIEMIQNSQSYSKIPLFISVDEEGGLVSRLGKNSAMGTTYHPPMRTIGDTYNPQNAYQIGTTLATELKEIGFNVDFAPVADVIIDERNTEIGNRSFGTDPYNVANMVESAVKGMEEHGLSAALKHFPGHGSTYVDTHTGYSSSYRTLDQLRENEFLPFAKGIEAGVDFIMVSHMTLVNATQEKVPSSISKEVITDWLLGELGYRGIVITDSFSMGAITQEYSQEEAVTKAISAGVDMILMPPNVETAHNAILSAVESGVVSRERIERSVRKILLLKAQKGLLN
ncbi:MAG: glycoside hydrolase family 3 protein [Ruminococcaceae bacterium]|nr:glycoside hydrolase family 3 protein [Oscillospiraceae bacterium]